MVQRVPTGIAAWDNLQKAVDWLATVGMKPAQPQGLISQLSPPTRSMFGFRRWLLRPLTDQLDKRAALLHDHISYFKANTMTKTELAEHIVNLQAEVTSMASELAARRASDQNVTTPAIDSAIADMESKLSSLNTATTPPASTTDTATAAATPVATDDQPAQ